MATPRNTPAPTAPAENVPASARPIADDKGRTAELHYSPAHLARMVAMKRAGKPINLPDGVTLEDFPEHSTTAPRGDSLRGEHTAGTAGSDASAE